MDLVAIMVLMELKMVWETQKHGELLKAFYKVWIFINKTIWWNKITEVKNKILKNWLDRAEWDNHEFILFSIINIIKKNK